MNIYSSNGGKTTQHSQAGGGYNTNLNSVNDGKPFSRGNASLFSRAAMSRGISRDQTRGNKGLASKGHVYQNLK